MTSATFRNGASGGQLIRPLVIASETLAPSSVGEGARLVMARIVRRLRPDGIGVNPHELAGKGGCRVRAARRDWLP
jgi:hypothetical protein